MEPTSSSEKFLSSSTLNNAELQSALQHISSVLTRPREIGAATSISHASRRSNPHVDDWTARRHALKQLSVFASEDISMRPRFTQWMSTYVKVPLQEHMEDPRSALAEAACAVVSALATGCSNRAVWLGMSGWFVSTLLAVAASTTRVVAGTAQHALHAMARTHGFGSEALGELVKAAGAAKHSATRYHAMDTLLAVMQASKGTSMQLSFSKYLTPVCRVIRSGMADANQGVRSTARTCYWVLASMEPEAAQTLFGNCDRQTQQLLEKEKTTALREVGAVTLASSADAAARETNTSAIIALAPAAALNATVPAGQRAVQLRDDLQAVAAAKVRRGSRGVVVGGGGAAAPAAVVATSRTFNAFDDVPAQHHGVRTADELWPEVRSALTNTDWAVRLSSCEALTTFAPQLSPENRDECAAALVTRLTDPHFRVCAAALTSFGSLFKTSPVFFTNHMQDVVLALLVNTTNTREVSASVSRELLCDVLSSVDIAVSSGHLYQCLADVATPKVHARAVEVLQYLFEDHYTFFMLPASMHKALTILASQLAEERHRSSQSVLWRAVARAVKTLYLVARDTFVRCLVNSEPLESPSQQQQLGRLTEIQLAMLYSALGPQLVPHVTEDCAAVAAGRVLVGLSSSSFSASVHVENPFREACAARRKCEESRGRRAGFSPLLSVHGRPLLDASNGHTVAVTEVDKSRCMDFGSSTYLSARPSAATVSAAKPITCNLFDSQFAPRHIFADPSAPFNVRSSRHITADPLPPLFVFHDDSDSDKRAPLRQAAGVGEGPFDTPADLLQRLLGTHTAAERRALLNQISSSISSARTSDVWASTEDVYDRLMLVVDRLATEQHEHDHPVRCAALQVLQSALESRQLRPCVARQLVRILNATRAALDDCFVEVQQEAVLVLHAALSANRFTPDMCLTALATCIEQWRRGPAREDYTRGWIELLNSVGRIFEQRSATGAASGRVRTRGGAAATLTEVALGRVSRAVHSCMEHCAPEVRRVAVLVFVAMWIHIQNEALPFFAPLSSSQRKLTSIYFNKVTRCIPPRDVAAEMRFLGLADAPCL